MKLIRLDNLFEVKHGHSLELNRLTKTSKDTGIPFISRKGSDNGIDCYVNIISDIEPNPAGDLTCALGGTVMATFLQERPYYTAFHVACLTAKVKLSKQQLLYYAACLSANRYKYNYGRQANKTLKELLIPSTDSLPDWVINSSVQLPESTKYPVINTSIPTLNTNDWKPFVYSELFSIGRGKGPRKKDVGQFGIIPFITSIDSNNGLSGYCSETPIHEANTITVNRNGSVAETFYQPLPFCSTEDVHVFEPKFKLNAFVGLFIATLIRKEKYRYSYGRKWGINRMNISIIKLPVKNDGTPDFHFMENYIKSLPYSSQI